MNKKISWDEIPSLDGLGIDWNYKPDKDLDKRTFVRLDIEAVSRLVEVRTIHVKLATANQTWVGELVDVSAGGVALTLPARLEIDQPVKVGFFLGATKIISRGLVRHAQEQEGRSLTGVQFVDLAPELTEYITALYAAKVFKHSI